MRGTDGMDATRWSSGTNGGNGGPGGDGGRGGDGGAAGAGAPVGINVDINDTDLLMLIEGVDVCAGRVGSGGAGGAGGPGGPGGIGGSSYSWTESITRHHADGSSYRLHHAHEPWWIQRQLG